MPVSRVFRIQLVGAFQDDLDQVTEQSLEFRRLQADLATSSRSLLVLVDQPAGFFEDPRFVDRVAARELIRC